MKESIDLSKKGIEPILYIDKKCPVTTPYDILHNQSTNRHGSVGVGFGATVEREENLVSLLAYDLTTPFIFEKLKLIQKYYEVPPLDCTKFLESIKSLMMLSNIVFVDDMPMYYDDYIFEGSQGLMLDKNIGFFPHVTRSNTDLTNLYKSRWISSEDEVYLVTRAYATRHGAGPFPTKNAIFSNDQEINTFNEFQKIFKTGLLNLNLLKYAIEKMQLKLGTLPKLNLVVTCLDHLEEYSFILNEQVITVEDEKSFLTAINKYLAHLVSSIYISRSPVNTIQEYYI
jgi:adenylosuccinate synthase